MITAASKECYLLDFLIENERTFDDDEEVQEKFKTLADDHIMYDYFAKIAL